MEQGAGQRHGHDRTALELHGSAVSQKHGHEVEWCIGNKGNDRVSRARFVYQIEQNENREHGFDHTTADQSGNHGRKCGRDHADDSADDTRLLAIVCRVRFPGTLPRFFFHLCFDCAEYGLNVVPDYDLELSAFIHYTDYS